MVAAGHPSSLGPPLGAGEGAAHREGEAGRGRSGWRHAVGGDVRWARPVDAPRSLQHDGVVLRHLVVRPAHGGRCRPAATGRGAELPVSRTVGRADDASRRTAEGDDGRTVVCLPTDLPATQSPVARRRPSPSRSSGLPCAARVAACATRPGQLEIRRTGSTPSRARSAVHLALAARWLCLGNSPLAPAASMPRFRQPQPACVARLRRLAAGAAEPLSGGARSPEERASSQRTACLWRAAGRSAPQAEQQLEQDSADDGRE
jgi:hypothetical protein